MQIQINEEKKELKQHGDYTFPVHLSGEMLSRYEGGSFFWHWHTEVELTLILKGQIEYRVNERTYHLKAGEGLFCNSNAMHAGKRIDSQDCQYFSVTFHPRFLYGFESSILQTKYGSYPEYVLFLLRRPPSLRKLGCKSRAAFRRDLRSLPDAISGPGAAASYLALGNLEATVRPLYKLFL